MIKELMEYLLMKWVLERLFKQLLFCRILQRKRMFGVHFWLLFQLQHFTIGKTNLPSFVLSLKFFHILDQLKKKFKILIFSALIKTTDQTEMGAPENPTPPVGIKGKNEEVHVQDLESD